MSGTRDMEEFKQEVRDDLKTLTSNVGELTKAIGDMATVMAVSEEQKKQQDQINRRLSDGLDTVRRDMEVIKLERAEEKQSRVFLMKWWPFLLIFATVGSAAVTAFFSGIGKNIAG